LLQKLENEGKTVIILSKDKQLVGLIAMADVLKKGAREAVANIQKAGLEVWLVSGDNERTTRAIAKEAGIVNVIAQVLPQDKATEIQELQKQGKRLAMLPLWLRLI
jgi:Cu+-exporting ATPase